MEIKGLRIHITGIVQGVGFRPFVYSLAQRLTLSGWVRNTSAGVDIEVDGDNNALDEFVQSLQGQTPPLAHIDEFTVQARPAEGYTDFKIIHSESIQDAFQPISPDVSICPDCLRELFDPTDRRYRYPFINCTNCGPRFTIIQDVPYDRPNTTMSGFPLCPDCAKEYSDPLNRRFHAQPVACPVCGPYVWLEENNTKHLEPGSNQRQVIRDDLAVQRAIELLGEGVILAIKGLGGFHLACDALNEQAVSTLRQRKLRVDKPFALMMPDIQTVAKHCLMDENDHLLLESRQRPIVILRKKPDSMISEKVAPYQDTLGVMLPYTPLHYLLFSKADQTGNLNSKVSNVLVMTSGNLSEEPIAFDNDEARQRLSKLADAFLMHNRPIRTRCDDSVMRVFSSHHIKPGANPQDIKPSKHNQPKPADIIPLRRSRGYAPNPIHLTWESPPLLATGAELKNSFCLARDQYAFLSHYIGDMGNYETLQSFEDGIQHYEHLFRVHPELIAYDLHPNYLATVYAKNRAEREGLASLGIQHHYAHIAGCIAENSLSGKKPVIGVAFDGTGYGIDGAIWGGEFLIADYNGFQRAAHLEYAPLPGGDAAIRKPARIALAYLWQANLPWESELPPSNALSVEERTALHSQLEQRMNTHHTSSMGRLFDAVAALAGVREKINYEAQAAIELEALVDKNEEGYYSLNIVEPTVGSAMDGASTSMIRTTPLQISISTLLEALLQDIHAGVPVSILSARFHNGVAKMVLDVCRIIRARTSLNEVALSGGVWQNMTLLNKSYRLLVAEGFRVYLHHHTPPNDGSIALGQAAIAAHWVNK